MDHIPRHIAIIPDGNRRWAREHHLPVSYGHKKGFDVCTQITEKARELGVSVVTLWGFSTENWSRDEEERATLFSLFESGIEQNLKKALKEKTRIIHLGRKDRFSESLQKKIKQAEDETCHFTSFYSCIGLDYGGHDELTRAMQSIIRSGISSSEITPAIVNAHLDTSELPHPYPDLIIRTGNEYRLSGLLPWQSAYSELVFVNKNFPDFSPADLENCIEEYKKRQRRFGT
ncbi:di-trans,poly-cis-decaprenylcistransferase [Candidatus Roizmanbacteria bacterium]|nr:di-trans,poly-cis-decaprenylcistransferase [Candidatus Roizmanbacteria bacterium]